MKFLYFRTLSEVNKLKIFPSFWGTTALEHLKIDRSQLTRIPTQFCQDVPHLKSLYDSNHYHIKHIQ